MLFRLAKTWIIQGEEGILCDDNNIYCISYQFDIEVKNLVEVQSAERAQFKKLETDKFDKTVKVVKELQGELIT